MADLKDRRKREDELAAAIAAVLRNYDDFSPVNLRATNFQRELQAAMSGVLSRAFVDFGAGASGELNYWTTALEPAAQEWANTFGAILAKSIDNQLAALRVANDESARAALASLTDPTRWARLAATDVTRAATAGGEFVAATAAFALGRSGAATWNTAADSRVCPICAPLDGQPRDVWAGFFPQGPPGHPNCRCWLDYFSGS